MKKSYEEIQKILDKSKGRFFWVSFVKRTTGEVRQMACRRGVTKYLKGGTLNYVPKNLNLFTVYEMENKSAGIAGGYKSIPVENILELKVGGKVFDFTK